MNDQFLGLTSTQFNTLVIVLLLVILGLVSFQYFMFFSTTNGISFGSGFAVNLFGKKKNNGN